MDLLKDVIAQKRKQLKDVAIEDRGIKIMRPADLLKKERDEFLKARAAEAQQSKMAKKTPSAAEENAKTSAESSSTMDLPRADVIQRLRTRSQPIRLFGESDTEALRRLRKHELEQPELKEGWKNDFQAALSEVDNELVDEVIKGGEQDVGRDDVVMPSGCEDATWDQIVERAALLGKRDDPNGDCDIIHEFIVYLLKRWGSELNERDKATKRSAQGKLEAGMHKQTMDNLRPLTDSLKRHTCNFDIRMHLINICRLCIIDRNYIVANNAYMEMAIGNAPWPVGVTRSGIHQRPGSAKAYVSNVAHVLNDETQRKYIHGLKRLMSKCQYYFPADPSKCVEYVRTPR